MTSFIVNWELTRPTPGSSYLIRRRAPLPAVAVAAGGTTALLRLAGL